MPHSDYGAVTGHDYVDVEEILDPTIEPVTQMPLESSPGGLVEAIDLGPVLLYARSELEQPFQDDLGDRALLQPAFGVCGERHGGHLP